MPTPQEMAALRWAGKSAAQRKAETQAARDAALTRSPEQRKAQTEAARAARAAKKAKKSRRRKSKAD